jgi:hypothetical protein
MTVKELLSFIRKSKISKDAKIIFEPDGKVTLHTTITGCRKDALLEDKYHAAYHAALILTND